MPITITFCNTHLVQIYELDTSLDAMGSTIKTVGSFVVSLECRAVELSQAEVMRYQQSNLVVTHKFHFATDPQLTYDKILYFDGDYFWIRKIKNEALLDEMWTVTAEKVPQSQL